MLQGGTAINLFERNMPRLSVDIDLTCVPIRPHAESLAAIDAAMGRTAVRIKRLIPRATISEGRNDEGKRTHLVACAEAVQCEIEVTPVLRGCEDVDGRDEPGHDGRFGTTGNRYSLFERAYRTATESPR
jgi:hypothetical protein